MQIGYNLWLIVPLADSDVYQQCIDVACLHTINSSMYHCKTTNNLKKFSLGSYSNEIACYRFEETIIGFDLSHYNG